MDLTKLSKPELLAKCEELGIKKYKSKNKGELIKVINQEQTISLKKKEFIIEDKHDDIVNETDILKKIDITPINDNIKIINADCMIELNKLEDNSIDFVITDPPYFIDKLDNKWCSNQINSDVKNSHITHLPKGMKFDKSQVKNLYDYYLELR
jgi:septin family protein